ncbi:hypothetical protein Q8A49_02510, partial [Nocardiopsis umidischolae]|nr:hypothetical protein [Nocardiopsis umidischolae]
MNPTESAAPTGAGTPARPAGPAEPPPTAGPARPVAPIDPADPAPGSSPRSGPDAPGRPRRAVLALAVLALAHFTISVDFNIVYIALPQIGADLGFGPASLQWVVTAFSLGY